MHNIEIWETTNIHAVYCLHLWALSFLCLYSKNLLPRKIKFANKLIVLFKNFPPVLTEINIKSLDFSIDTIKMSVYSLKLFESFTLCPLILNNLIMILGQIHRKASFEI